MVSPFSHSAEVLGGQGGGADDGAGPEGGEDLVGFGEWVRGDADVETDSAGEGEELLGVAAGQVGDAADDALFPEEAVGERGDVAHVDSAADHGAGLAHGA